MKATHIGKTIIVWDKISDNEAAEILQVLKDIIQNCRNLGISDLTNKIVPISLTGQKQYLCVVKKNEEIMISTTRYKNADVGFAYNFSALLNADDLYKSLAILKDSYFDIKDNINTLQKCPESKWITLPISEAFETYALTPNMNPEDFIKNLEKGTLTNMQKNFLKEVGFALENSNFSKELEDAIKDANGLFEER